MDAQTWVGLATQLGRRRREIADAWHAALSAIDVASFQTIEGYTIIAGWVDQVIELLLTDPFDRAQAEGLGSALADLGLGQPEVLGQTQEILGTQFTVELPSQDTQIVQQRTISLLSSLAVGFVRHANAHTAVRCRQTEAALNARAAETELLRRETHHRIKNNLTVIASLLELQADQSADQSVREALNEGRDRVRSMAYIHEQLSQTSKPGEISLAAYIHDLLEHLYCIYGYSQADVKACVDVDDYVLNIDLATPVGLIINELVSNAFKHAFPRQHAGNDLIPNEISISVHLADTQLAIEVSDNGAGLPEALDVEKAESLGLTLVRLLVRQIGGTLRIVKRKRGTTFEIVAPKPNT